jgi:hypothetical protein
MSNSVLQEAWAHSDVGKRLVLLSENGCGRATAYGDCNKIITIQDKTHVAWLDTIAEGFRVRCRTLDRTTNQWSPIYTVGEAYDNHGGPALTVDSSGYLHIVYYPHHHPFRYRRSVQPNDASEWEDEIEVGERCTYPMMVCGPDDTLYLTARQSRGSEPWVVNLYIKPPDAPWQDPISVFQDDAGGYVCFQQPLAWGHDRRTLHMTLYIFDENRSYTVGYLRSPDSGKTWERADGTPVSLPATRETVTLIDTEHKDLSSGSIAVDGASTPHILYCTCPFYSLPSEAWIVWLDERGKWCRRSLADELSKEWAGWSPGPHGALHIAPDGRIFVVMSLMNLESLSDNNWGHKSSEIIGFQAPNIDGKFSVELLSKPDMTVPHWIPNIERSTGHNRVDVPGVIYTAGVAGAGCDDILSNSVYWTEMQPQ